MSIYYYNFLIYIALLPTNKNDVEHISLTLTRNYIDNRITGVWVSGRLLPIKHTPNKESKYSLRWSEKSHCGRVQIFSTSLQTNHWNLKWKFWFFETVNTHCGEINIQSSGLNNDLSSSMISLIITLYQINIYSLW